MDSENWRIREEIPVNWRGDRDRRRVSSAPIQWPPNARAPRAVAEPAAQRVITWGEKHDKKSLQPGVIISFPHHVHDYLGAPDSSGRSITKPGFYCFTKLRKFVIVKCYERHCITIPIYTHSGYGLTHQTNPNEYVGVRDASIPNPPPSNSIHANFLVQKTAQWRNDTSKPFHDIDPKSHAQWTRPVCFNYDSTCEIEGYLQNEADSARLVALYYSDAPEKRTADEQVDNERFRVVRRGGGRSR